MTQQVRSFAKINLGLRIGPRRGDGFHDLLTLYQTIALHDLVRVSIGRGDGIEIRSNDPRVPPDESNTCYRIVELAARGLNARGKIVVEIEKRLPVQGGMGGASSNAVASMLGLERALKKSLPADKRLKIAAEVGSDLPLFLIGGTVLGVGRGEQVYPLADLPAMACVVVTPEIGVSTPKAFAEWDRLCGRSKLTSPVASDRMSQLASQYSAWLSESYSGAPRNTRNQRGRAENPLLKLVRTGIENDFEEVVFPEYPELSEIKQALLRAGATYASLSGSGSTLYGLFASRDLTRAAAGRLRAQGLNARATATLPRRVYWRRMFGG